MKLYTNSNEKHDRIGMRLKEICHNRNLYISTAFFSNSNFILTAINNGCARIDLIVRLDFGTSPDELKKILNNPSVNIRYYNSRRFHPKFYIIDGFCAIVGSSNLTNSGLMMNQEVNVEIEPDNPIYEELKYEFSLEWQNADVLTPEKLARYKEIYDEASSRIPSIAALATREFGEAAPANITILDKKEPSKLYMESFRKEYQHYISVFEQLKSIYITVSENRKYDESCPLRIEIDGFLSWLWDNKCDHDSWDSRPVLTVDEISKEIKALKSEFVSFTGNNYYDNLPSIHFLPEFNTKDKIEKLNVNTICDSLEKVWAFHDRLRFFTGGLQKMRQEFIEKNGEKIKSTIIYILYGKEEYVERIYNALYLPKYKLEMFGDSCVKELFGLVNKEDIPICNGRTKKVIQWLGFGQV